MKKQVRILMLALVGMVFLGSANAQVKVGDNPTTINASSMLEIESTTKGFLPPRMTNAQMKAIANPTEGLMVYNTTLGCMAYYVDSSFNCTHNQPAIAAPDAPLGSTYTTHYNGIISGAHVGTTYQDSNQTTGETFNNNATCANKMISAQGCAGLTSVTGASGTVYPVTNINGQCWMTNSLKEVPSNFTIHTPTSWQNTTPGDQGYWGYYNTTTLNGTAGWGLTEPAAGEGLLYQWSAAMDNSLKERSRGACPTGFHVPSDCEWMYLEHGQGLSLANQILTGWRGSGANSDGTAGTKLRAGGTNASGFSALLGGHRGTNGTFNSRGAFGYWWSSSEASASNAFYRDLLSSQTGVTRFSNNKALGFSVRCLKD